MKHGYMHHLDRKYSLSVPQMKIRSSSPNRTETAACRLTEERRVDEIKARAASVPLRLTFG
jgi:hypothetical protein